MRRAAPWLAALAIATAADAQEEPRPESRVLELESHGTVHVVPFEEFLGRDAPGERMTGSAKRCGFRIGDDEAARWIVTIGARPGLMPPPADCLVGRGFS